MSIISDTPTHWQAGACLHGLERGQNYYDARSYQSGTFLIGTRDKCRCQWTGGRLALGNGSVLAGLNILAVTVPGARGPSSQANDANQFLINMKSIPEI